MHKLARAPFISVPLLIAALASPATASATESAPAAAGDGVQVDAQALRATVTARLPQVTRCYERELKRRPGLEGRLEVRFTIGGDGTVLWSGVVQDSIGLPSLARCVATQFQSFRFRAIGLQPGQEVTVAYPLVFSKAGRAS